MPTNQTLIGEGTTTTAPTPIDPQFFSLDGDVKLPQFIVAMLRVGQILTAKESIVREVTAEQISKIMNRNRNTIPCFRPREIRESWEYYHCYQEGGGVQIEGYELPFAYRGPRHYHFTFSKLYTAEETQKMRQIQEPDIPIQPQPHDHLRTPA